MTKTPILFVLPKGACAMAELFLVPQIFLNIQGRLS